MEILKEICRIFNNENQIISTIIIVINTICWTIIDIKMAEQLLKMKIEKNKYIIWLIVEIIATSIAKILLPPYLYKVISIVIFAIIMRIITKVEITKCILVQIIDYIAIFAVEAILIKPINRLLGINSLVDNINIPKCRFTISVVMLTSIYITYKIIKWKNIVFTFQETLTLKRKLITIILVTIGVIVISGKSSYILRNNSNIYVYLSLLLDATTIVIAFILGLKYMMNIVVTDKNKMEIENLKFYNSNLNELYDNVRAFRHDFGNIIQAMGGYIYSEDIESLKKMYKDLCEDCEENKKLEVLNPGIINNAAIYNIINEKYNKAKKLKVQMNIEIYTNLENLQMKTYELSRTLGILIDNAIEAAKNQEEKIVNLRMKKENRNNRNIIVVENTFDEKKVDLDKIFEKGYTTKEDTENKHGLGLWEVRKILKRNDNLNLYTHIENNYFIQQLEIYNYQTVNEKVECKL